MGGHAAGDVASRLAVSEVFAELTHWSADPSDLEQKLRQVFQSTLHNANAAIAEYADAEPDQGDLGTTLLVPVVISARLYWAVGWGFALVSDASEPASPAEHGTFAGGRIWIGRLPGESLPRLRPLRIRIANA